MRYSYQYFPKSLVQWRRTGEQFYAGDLFQAGRCLRRMIRDALYQSGVLGITFETRL